MRCYHYYAHKPRWKSWVSHSSVAVESSLLGCDTVSLDLYCHDNITILHSLRDKFGIFRTDFDDLTSKNVIWFWWQYIIFGIIQFLDFVCSHLFKIKLKHDIWGRGYLCILQLNSNNTYIEGPAEYDLFISFPPGNITYFNNLVVSVLRTKTMKNPTHINIKRCVTPSSNKSKFTLSTSWTYTRFLKI